MTFVIDGAAGVDLTKTDSVARYSVGTVVRTDDGQFTYVKHALAAAAIGTSYKIQEDYQTVALTSTESGDEPTNVGVFQIQVAAGTSVPQYAFAFTGFGNFNALVATGTSAGLALTTTASAGILGSGGDAVGAALVTGNSSGGNALRACFAPGKLATNA